MTKPGAEFAVERQLLALDPVQRAEKIMELLRAIRNISAEVASLPVVVESDGGSTDTTIAREVQRLGGELTSSANS